MQKKFGDHVIQITPCTDENGEGFVAEVVGLPLGGWGKTEETAFEKCVANIRDVFGIDE